MRHNTRQTVFLKLAILVSGCISTPILLGQQANTGALVGTVFDPAQSAVPDAKVEVTNTATGVVRQTTTNAEGQYRFGNLAGGTHDLKVTAVGFDTVTVRGLLVDLSQTVTANVDLKIGDVSTVIEVTDTAALIDTTTAQISQTFQRREAIDTPSSALPLGVLNLSLLSAGVASSGGLGLGDGPSVGGQRPRNNNFTVEGVDNNRKDVTGHNIDVPNEAVAQFTALQNQYSAELGNGTGGQFNTTIRSGGNDIHGAIFEYLQNRNLNATDEKFKRQGIRSNPRYDQNTLGGSIGGPIIKNKLFYYGLYQYNPLGQEGSASAAIYAPTAAGYNTLALIPGVSQTNFNVLKQYLPAAAASDGSTTVVSGVSIPLGIIPVTQPSFTNTHNWLISSDYDITENDRLRGRYIANNIGGFSTETLPALPAFFLGRNTTAKLASLSYIHTFSPTLVNEFRVGYNRYNDNIPSGNFRFPGLDVFPNITIEDDLNLQLGPYDQSPQSGIINTYQGIDNVTWTKGRHTLKFGAEFRKYIAPQLFVQRIRGDYGYSNLERYLLDQNPDLLAERNVGGAVYSGNQINWSGFINDQWQFSRSLSVNLGLRYEYKGMPRDSALQELNAISSVPGLIEFRKPKAQKTNFAPRIGVAYSPGTNGNTVIRGGFGLAYDKYFDNLVLLSLPPQISSTIDVNAEPITTGFLANGGIRPNTGTGPACVTAEECRDITSSYIPDQKLPYSIQWNVGYQRVLFSDFTFEARYLGTRGVHLFTQTRMNAAPKVTSSVFIPTYLQTPSAATLASEQYTLGDITARSGIVPQFEPYFSGTNITSFPNRGNSIYHGLALELRKRFSRNLLFQAAYTWSHNIDDSTADLFSTVLSPRRPQDFQDMRSERSTSFLDRRQRFTYNAIYDLPWFRGSKNSFVRIGLGGFILSGTYTYESPQFATVQSSRDSNLNGDAAGDRAIVNSAGIPNTGSGIIALNRAGEVVPRSDPGIVAYVAQNPTAQYIVAGEGALANSGRQTMATRPINNVDFQVKKEFAFRERYKLQFAAQFFNIFNHAQYIPGYLNNVQFHDSTTTNNNLIPGNPQFNRPDLVYDSNSRTIQLTGRLQFLEGCSEGYGPLAQQNFSC